MTEKRMNLHQGHWALASLGKKVLRPGGLEMTHEMLNNLDINAKSDVVEFAPGLGMTSVLAASKQPQSYTVVEINQEAAAIAMRRLRQVYSHPHAVLGSAAQTGARRRLCQCGVWRGVAYHAASCPQASNHK